MKKLIFFLAIFLINYYGCASQMVKDPIYVEPVYELPDKTEFKECYEPDELHKADVIHIRPCWVRCEVGTVYSQSNKYAVESRLIILININQPATVSLLPPIVMSGYGAAYMCSKVGVEGFVYDAQTKELKKNQAIIEAKEFNVSNIPIKILEFSETPVAFYGQISMLFPIKKQDMEVIQEGYLLPIPLQIQVKEEKHKIFIPITCGAKKSDLKTSK